MKHALITTLFALTVLSMCADAAVIVVDTLDDSTVNDGQCSLREAITNANFGSVVWPDCPAGSADGTTIRFSSVLMGGTIALNTPLPTLKADMAIGGISVPTLNAGMQIRGFETPPIITLDGQQAWRLIEVSGHVSVQIQDMKLTGGLTTGSGMPGGAMRIVDGAEVELTRVAFSGNATQGNSSNGGAIAVVGASLSLSDCELSGNQVSGLSAGGGAIFASDATVSMSGTTVANNLADASTGGGIRLRDGSVLTATNSTISDNSSGQGGGGIYVFRSHATLTHTTVAFNSAGASTQGIHVIGTEDEPATLVLENALVVQATPNQVTCSAAGAGGSIISTGSLSTHAGCTGTATPVDDIGLRILAYNGGETRTHGLSPDSVAVEAAGDCAGDLGVTVDQRGISRPGSGSGACDIGAFEVTDNEPVTDLAVTKTVSPEAVDVGDIVIFTLEASNHGPHDAFAVQVTDELPEGYALISAMASAGDYDETSGLWNIDMLEPGAATLTIEATVIAGDDYLNIATITGGQFDPDPGNNSDQAEPAVGQVEADLGIAKEVVPAQANVGQNVTFTLTASNLGPDNATGVTVLDQLPAGYSFVSAAGDSGGYDESSGQWTIGVLAPGASAVLEIEAAVTGVNDYLNTASIDGDQDDPDLSNNSDSAAITLISPAAAIIVDTLQDEIADDGFCSLREAIVNAVNNNRSGSVDCEVANVIRFDETLVGGTIELSGTQLPAIDNHLTIEGPVTGDPAGITLDGRDLSRIFNIVEAITVHLSDMTLTNGRTTGTAISGGAIRIFDGPDVTLTRMRLTGNVSQDSSGGAIFVHESRLTLIDSELSDNQSLPESGRGGAVDALDSLIFLDGTTVVENHAVGSGGGLNLTRSTLNAVNSTLSGNVSGGSGGGINLDGAVATLTHTTVAFNTAASGGSGIYASASADFPVELSMVNSLAVDNHCHVSGGANYTLVSAGSLSTAAGCVEGAATPSEAIDLIGLADNGGLTRTHALGAGSAAIGFAGNCPLDFDIEFDQRGEPRPGGGSGACDAGAYEFQGQYENLIFGDRFEN